MKQKTVSPLTELQHAQTEKYLFQNYLLERPQDIEEGLWKIYVNFGRGKFRNMTFEKGITNGTITWDDIIDKSGYSHLSDGWCLRLEIIQGITKWIGLNNSQEYGTQVSRKQINNTIKLFEKNRKKINIAFDIRDRTKGELDTKSCVQLINKVLDKWGFSKLKKGKKTRKLVEGKLVDISDFQIQGKEQIDIYKYIKPRKIDKNPDLCPEENREDPRFYLMKIAKKEREDQKANKKNMILEKVRLNLQ